MRALLLVGCLAVVAPLAPAPKRTVARRAALLGFSSAAVLAPAAARAEDLLEVAGKVVTVLKPLYGFEAPLQAKEGQPFGPSATQRASHAADELSL